MSVTRQSTSQKRHILEYKKTCLDKWPEKFEKVKIIEHIGAGVAPWNVNDYEMSQQVGRPMVNNTPVIFYHYHEFARLYNGDYLLCQFYKIPKTVIECFYKPYISELKATQDWINTFDPTFHYCKEKPSPVNSLKEIIKSRIPPDIIEYIVNKLNRKKYVIEKHV